ncbi:MAG: hypothetical protein NTW96_04210 [Planctomycetia bacterium]|nr:hypothetical protein [Planctomycetia bacterium]
MKVRELIDLLERFEPTAEVRLCVNWPDRVAETYERIWVGDYGGGPRINAAVDFRGVEVYVGCVLDQRMPNVAPRRVDLGQYDNAETAARVRDFYVVHRGLDEPLNFPDFDYDKWIPPRTRSGEYNGLIAEILKEKLLRD